MGFGQNETQELPTKQPNNNNTINNTIKNNTKPSNKSKGYIVIPYVQGLCESIKNMCGKYGIQIYFKDNRILKEHSGNTKG